MSKDGPGTGQGSNIFRKVIGGLPGSRRRHAGKVQPDMPEDYEASLRELMGNIVQLSDGDRVAAAELGNREQIAKLYATLDREDMPTAVSIIEAMGDAGNADAADVLVILLDYPEEAVRAHAALTLGRLGQRSAVEPLIQALDDRSDLVGENAAVALGMLGDNRAEIPLQKVPIAKPRVKKAAVGALAKIESRRH